MVETVPPSVICEILLRFLAACWGHLLELGRFGQVWPDFDKNGLLSTTAIAGEVGSRLRGPIWPELGPHSTKVRLGFGRTWPPSCHCQSQANSIALGRVSAKVAPNSSRLGWCRPNLLAPDFDYFLTPKGSSTGDTRCFSKAPGVNAVSLLAKQPEIEPV